MKIFLVIYYIFKRMFGQPNNFHRIADVNDEKGYVVAGNEMKIMHRDYGCYQEKSALWRLTREQIVNGLKADAYKILHCKTMHLGLLDISYIEPCTKR